MAGKNGSSMFVGVNTGTSETPVWTVIPCQTDGSYTVANSSIDTSCKDARDGTNIPGRATRTLSVEGNITAWPEILSSPTEALEVIRKAAETGVQVGVAIYDGAASIETCTATIENVDLPFPDQDKMTFSIDFAISGPMTPVV